MLENELINLTDSQKNCEPNLEITNTFYKVYEIFKNEIAKINQKNTIVKKYNENLLPTSEERKNDQSKNLLSKSEINEIKIFDEMQEVIEISDHNENSNSI